MQPFSAEKKLKSFFQLLCPALPGGYWDSPEPDIRCNPSSVSPELFELFTCLVGWAQPPCGGTSSECRGVRFGLFLTGPLRWAFLKPHPGARIGEWVCAHLSEALSKTGTRVCSAQLTGGSKGDLSETLYEEHNMLISHYCQDNFTTFSTQNESKCFPKNVNHALFRCEWQFAGEQPSIHLAERILNIRPSWEHIRSS